MAEKKDYYETLGIDRNSSKEDIKKAYKRLAKENHPDRFMDANEKKAAEEKFKKINEAAAVLGDDDKRAHYDNYGDADSNYDFSQAGFSDFSRFSGMGADFDFGDIFDQFFGGGGSSFSGGRRRSDFTGDSLRFDLTITLEEVSTGVEKKFSMPRLETCSDCKGSGAKHDADVGTCQTCNGTGRETVVRRTPFGLFQTSSTCRKCKGEGTVISNPCKTCGGEGRVKTNATLKIRIPAGIESGTRLRVAGEGDAGQRGGQSGDLYVVVQVSPHKIFERQGSDIIVEIPISFTQATLGDTIEVPIINGSTKIKIPEGTQSGTILNLKGKGLPFMDGYGQGSEKIRITVLTPTRLSKKAKDLLKELAKEMGTDSTPNESFFDKLKKKL
ncbi:MAG: molecular chaperone DnaJ [archaeon]